MVSITSASPVGDGRSRPPPPPLAGWLGPLLLIALVLALDLAPVFVLSGFVLIALGDHFAIADLAAPSLDFVRVQQALRHHVPPEVLEFETRPPALCPPDIAGAFEQAPRVVFQDQDDAGEVGRQLVKGHGAVDMTLRAFRAPDDPLIRDLLDDRRLP